MIALKYRPGLAGWWFQATGDFREGRFVRESERFGEVVHDPGDVIVTLCTSGIVSKQSLRWERGC